jgi:predicted Fe-S protein YdhL (DUF1289 family)
MQRFPPADVDAASSPCLGDCTLDATRLYCVACRRTIDEIATWSQLTDEQKQAVRSLCESRRVEQDGRREGDAIGDGQ